MEILERDMEHPWLFCALPQHIHLLVSLVSGVTRPQGNTGAFSSL